MSDFGRQSRLPSSGNVGTGPVEFLPRHPCTSCLPLAPCLTNLSRLRPLTVAGGPLTALRLIRQGEKEKALVLVTRGYLNCNLRVVAPAGQVALYWPL